MCVLLLRWLVIVVLRSIAEWAGVFSSMYTSLFVSLWAYSEAAVSPCTLLQISKFEASRAPLFSLLSERVREEGRSRKAS